MKTNVTMLLTAWSLSSFESVDLAEESSEMFKRLRGAMYPTCSPNDVDFGEIEDLHEHEYGESVLVSVDLELVEPMYNVQRNRAKKKSDDNCLSADDMKAMVRLCTAVLKPRGHEYLSCMAFQFVQCPLPLLSESEEEGWVLTTRSRVAEKEDSGES